MKKGNLELTVGLFVLLGLACLAYLAIHLGKMEIMGQRLPGLGRPSTISRVSRWAPRWKWPEWMWVGWKPSGLPTTTSTGQPPRAYAIHTPVVHCRRDCAAQCHSPRGMRPTSWNHHHRAGAQRR